MESSEHIRKYINLIENNNKSIGPDDIMPDDEEWLDRMATIRQAMRSIAQWNTSAAPPNETDWQICMDNLPNARYTGMMYRGISLQTVNLKTVSNIDLLTKIKAEVKSYKRQIVGWSKDRNMAASFCRPFGIILSQHSTGLDLDNLYNEESDELITPAFAEYEQEVLAYTSPTVRLYGFAITDDDDNTTFYTPEQFIEFQKQIQNIEPF